VSVGINARDRSTQSRADEWSFCHVAINKDPETPRWRNPDAISIALLLVLSLIVIAHRWVFDNWLARHDLLTFFLPWLGSLGDRLGALDIPALNPYIFSGAPCSCRRCSSFRSSK
jgi:hypothetical protein